MNQMYDQGGAYNNYNQTNMPYGQPSQQQQPYGAYDYGMQIPPQQTFNAYVQPPVVMQPIPPGNTTQTVLLNL